MISEMKKEHYSLSFSGGKLKEGFFGEIKLIETPFFYTEIKYAETGESFSLSSAELCVKEEKISNYKYFSLLSRRAS